MKLAAIKLFMFTIFAVAYYGTIDEPYHTDVFFLISCIVAITFNLRYPNILSWVAIIMVMRLAEFLIFHVSFAEVLNYPLLHYAIQCTLDLLVIILINKRSYYYYRFFPNAKEDDFYYSVADTYLIGIYFLYLLIGALSIIESIIRRPERIGLPAEWGNHNILFIYNNFEELKALVSILLLGVLWMSITNYFKKSGKYITP